MSWTSPRTWVSEEVVTAAILNTHVRDQFGFLGTHGHSGGAGDGAQAVGSLSVVTFADQAGDPGAAGTLQRNGAALKYHDGVGVVVLSGTAVAGTASLRALGTANGTQAAPGIHTHTVGNRNVGNIDNQGSSYLPNNTTAVTLATGTPGNGTATGTNESWAVTGVVHRTNNIAITSTFGLKVYVDTTLVASVVSTLGGGNRSYLVSGVLNAISTGAVHSVKLAAQRVGTGSSEFHVGGAIGVRAFSL
jgi:hypothetical protein